MATLHAIAARLDELLATRDTPDYPPAVNGIQLENRAEIRGVAVAVDCSQRTIDGAIAADANLLIVHHGLLWGGIQPIRGAFYERLYRLLSHGIAVYSSHLPLDAHPELGNNVLLARELGLEPNGRFARFQSLEIGVRGEAEIPTRELVARSDSFARRHGGQAIATEFAEGRVTRRWGICTGAGASAETLREAVDAGLDTLIVGEGPHWTAVDAPELGLVIIYAGHYATETLGVQALGRWVEREFALPWRFVEAPTGL
ncbi:MAG: Nif3-like dinuclear metal center hexameric protein [Gemmatimonadaceae bacterium]|nr:Nif3-like dinuclear metal center hexameric protein [Gemmatimonadaceae bacterium]NUQ94951.1 Nif3-like dinuclear metal center hexameric protein [Gemmatimonadaceae bacterium]NUR18197.1 Nif3-like dinuclear metal center hexameric protein [Gemmatimonadaceae bacterium]NUS97545.1 Nif3-like dinuclear metal center hexameric protein [Gemmatimonadaceae bacterium]